MDATNSGGDLRGPKNALDLRRFLEDASWVGFGLRMVTASLAICLASACSLGALSSMSPALKEDARRYSEVMDDFSDQALLANVLRAKDYAPLNFNDLSTISGSLSISGTAGFTWPFGPFAGGKPLTSLGTYKNTFSPSVTGSVSPVMNLSTLNTQGFMLTLIQPISNTYVLSKWDSYPHDLLLYLFVKSIRFPEEEDPIRNDPDSPEDFAKFQELIDEMTDSEKSRERVGGHVDMRAVSLLDPLGTPVPIGRTFTSVTPIPAPAGSSTTLPPVAPQLYAAPLQGSRQRDYFVRITYIINQAESGPSTESFLTLQDGQGLTVKSPSRPKGIKPEDDVRYNVYVATASNNESRQNDLPLKLGKSWSEPFHGLVAGMPVPGNAGNTFTVNSDISVFQTINGLTDGQLHAGNAKCPRAVSGGAHAMDLCPPEYAAPFVQFYKEYVAQVVLCLRTGEDGRFFGHLIAPMSDAEKAARAERLATEEFLRNLDSGLASVTIVPPTDNPDVTKTKQAAILWLTRSKSETQDKLDQSEITFQDESALADKRTLAMAKASPSSNAASGAPAPAAAPSTGGGGSAGASAAGSGVMPQVTMALQPSRVSAILHSASCQTDQLVLSAGTEQDFSRENAQFTHVQWRSISEVIQYVGALARYQDTHESPFAYRTGALHKSSRLFSYDAGAGRLSTKYLGSEFHSPKVGGESISDHSLQVLALMNELVGLAKISGSLPVTQPVQVLP